MAKALTHDGICADDYVTSVKTMRTAAKIINPKHSGLRTYIINNRLKMHTIRAMSHPFYEEIDKSIDYLNLEHSEWFSCVNNVSKGTSSFIDLLDDARLSYLEIENIFNDSLIDSAKKSRLDNYIKEKNHNGFKTDSELKFFDEEFSKIVQNS